MRSVLQHAWATAVETVGTFTQQALKSSVGEEQWLRFFALMGTAVARREATPAVPDTPQTKTALRSELRQCVRSLDVEARLRAYGQALVTAEQSGLKKAHYFLLSLNPVIKRVDIYGFKASELQSAARQYLKIERSLVREQGGDAVLVSVESMTALKRAYPNYFLDTSVFLDAVKEAIRR